MIVRIVKLSLYPDKIGQFLQSFNDVKEQIRTFEGCHHMELLTDPAGSGIVFTYSTWENEGFLDNYRNSELFQTTWACVKPLFASKAEAWTLNKYDLV